MIQVESRNDEVFLSVDSAGIDELIAALAMIKNGGDHDHFMSPVWGGNGLAEGVRVSKESNPVNHLKIFFVYEPAQSSSE